MSNDGSLGIVVGPPGSGRSRYACAMALYQAGRISAAQLETYRVVAGNDAESPVALLAERGLALPLASPIGADLELQTLLAEADRYIATLPGPGIAGVRSGLARARVAPPVPLIAALDAARFQLHVHCIGDRATRVTLDGIEAARRANGFWPALHQIAHARVTHPDDWPRLCRAWCHGQPATFVGRDRSGHPGCDDGDDRHCPRAHGPMPAAA